MKILLLYPKCPETFWSMNTALKVIGKKTANPPLGILTVAAMLPKRWQKKLVDLNVSKLKDSDIQWADMVMISAMIIQKDEVNKLVERIKSFDKKIVAGGPLFTTGFEDFKEIDHLVLGEGEETLVKFLKDLKNKRAKKVYQPKVFPEVRKTVIPDWNLINFKNYNSLSVQYSRGCPFNCEFCDIVRLNGRVPRLKTTKQIISELDVLYKKGWRDAVFFVDDNFIGNKEILRKEVLPTIIEWQKKKNYPFFFNTQTSVNLADDEELMDLMVKSGFRTVFVGIETPDDEGLKECGKFQNKNRSLLDTVKKMQSAGLEVQAGFILGFDSDTPSIFKRQIDFIQKSGIVTAMVGLLTASPMTRLYYRLKESGRLLKESTGNNTSIELNFVPIMDKKMLVDGYKNVLKAIYNPRDYYQRVATFLHELKFPYKPKINFHWYYVRAVLGSVWFAGIISKGKREYWKLLTWSIFKRPACFPQVITFSLMGLHFRKICLEYAKD